MESVLNIHGFDLQRTLAALPNFLDPDAATTKHDGSVTSVSLNQGGARHLRTVQRGPLDLFLTKQWLRGLLDERGADIFRIKGVLAIAHAHSRYVCHAVHTIFSDDFEQPWEPDESRLSKLVFIGKGLDEKELAAGFDRCLATPRCCGAFYL